MGNSQTHTVITDRDSENAIPLGSENATSLDSENATPPKPEGRSRVLSIDPRSPSVDISRTPIVVDKTPEGILHDPLDPRSPTVGIDRTPLASLPGNKTVADKMEIVRHVEVKDEEDEADWENEPLCDCEGTAEMPPRTLDPLGLTGIEDMSLEDFPNSESTRLMPDEQMLLDVTDKIRLKKKKSKAAQPKELFPAKKASSTKDSTRSPLSTRTFDMNSPAKLVQRKQIKDLDKKMTCAQDNSLSRFIVRDKENV